MVDLSTVMQNETMIRLSGASSLSIPMYKKRRRHWSLAASLINLQDLLVPDPEVGHFSVCPPNFDPNPIFGPSLRSIRL